MNERDIIELIAEGAKDALAVLETSECDTYKRGYMEGALQAILHLAKNAPQFVS